MEQLFSKRKARPYLYQRQVLCVENDIILKGTNPVIPEILRKQVIQAAHATHFGVRATKYIIQKEAWWPNLSRDVEDFVKACEECNKLKSTTRNVHIDQWPQEHQPWSRVHMDHAHISQVGTFLILVDSYSGWPEVVKVMDRTVSSTINALRVIFARQGVPLTLVSDNAGEFSNETFNNWLMNIGCRPCKTPPYHPQSNGTAERMVRTIKTGMKMWQNKWGNFNAYLNKLLLNYRTIPHGNRQKSSSELMGRQIRSAILCSSVLTPGKKVLYNGQDGEVVVQKGTNTFFIKRTTDGGVVLAHRDQIKLSDGDIIEEEEMDASQQSTLEEAAQENRRSARLVEKTRLDYMAISRGMK